MIKILLFLAAGILTFIGLSYLGPDFGISFRQGAPYLAVLCILVSAYCIKIGALSIKGWVVYRADDPVTFWTHITFLAFLAVYLALYPLLPWAKP